MRVKKIIKPSFTVIGIEGSTSDGGDFIGKLWETANARFGEIMDLCKRDENGVFAGFWGAMSDFSRAFQPWDNFERGLYLAGAECEDSAGPPEGWTKWVIPSFEYLVFDREEYDFGQAMATVTENGFSLAGAVHDFTDPGTGKGYIYVPIKKLD